MMIVPMDKMSAPSSRQRAQRLYDKSLELENKIRRSAQARVLSDPNAWQQMRENYEAIVLEDHAFSEQHNVEYALWQLHYRRIEELRAHFSTALASTTENTSQGLKGPPRSDRVSKIRSQFKTFLSEATGFYHDLIVKLRGRYGLPLNNISEDSDYKIATEKDGKQSAELKKGLVSCHRCLIYLGDLARYKGLYGEADAKTREYGAASSYYLQASSICPSSGNPHHQLAILASYSGDEFVAIYRYFRSLAVDNPFTTARDNLIVAFEKNRQSFAQLSVDVRAPLLKESAAPARLAGKGVGKMEAKYAPKATTKRECSPVKDRPKSIQELFKFFCVRFVRLNGLLFTRASLETFSDLLTLVTNDLCELLSSGPDEELKFGADVSDDALFAVRLVAILVYTVHNLKKQGEGQTYADIVQRAVLLQNGFTAVFQLMGHIVERCLKVHDICSSFLLPGILVFLEWISCSPDVAVPTSDMDEKQSTARSKLWKNCTLFLNKISVAGSMCVDNKEDESCFFSMSQYEEGGNDDRIALWEDFELRGFLPLLPAHSILDFSRKRSVGSDGTKEKKVRVDRILAAGKALVNVIKVDQQTVYFDQKTKKFVIAVEPSEDEARPFSSGPLRVNGVMQDDSTEKTTISDSMHVNSTSRKDGFVDDDDEVIVFKPAVAEKKMNAIGHGLTQSNGLKNGENNSTVGSNYFSVSVSPPANISEYSTSDPSPPALNGGIPPRCLQRVHSNGLTWSLEQGSHANSLKTFALFENGHSTEQKVPASYGFYHPTTQPGTIHQPSRASNGATIYNQINAPERLLSSTIDAIAGSGFGYGNLALNTSVGLPVAGLKNSIGRPASHIGPPPGFSCVSKPLDARSASDLDSPVMDDYSWLDGYHLTSSVKSAGLNDYAISHGNAQYVNNISNGFSAALSFPFPGKQHPSVQFQSEKQKVLHDYQTLEQLKFKADVKLQQQQLSNLNQQNISLLDQCQGRFVWTGQYLV